MDQYRPRSQGLPPIAERTRKWIGAAWLIASLALPVMAAALVAQTASTLAEYATRVEHVVQRGDTLYGIALRYGVTVQEIVQANGLADPNRIYAGQVLAIPREDAATGEGIYVVSPGDSVSLIARRYNTSVDAIASANGLANPDVIEVGQRLLIPGAAAALEAAPQVQAVSADYTLQRGDSLYRVSLVFGVSVDDLLAANELASPNAIYPGLTIRVPAAQAAAQAVGQPPGIQTGGLTYTVAPGDTLARIAIAYNTTVDGIVAANGLLRADRIYAGQVLNIPQAGAAARPSTAVSSTTYTVVRGDTLGAIALRYGVTLSSLAVANGISNVAAIYPGMVLSIPSASAGSNSVRYASVGPGLCQGVEVTRSGTGYFLVPTHSYIVTQRFTPWHAGIDLATDTGTQVYASDGGTVVYVGWNTAGYGNLIVLDHGNGWRTYYAHLSGFSVSCGDWVPRGSIVGAVGSTGNSTGPHLHFEILRYGIAINPEGYARF